MTYNNDSQSAGLGGGEGGCQSSTHTTQFTVAGASTYC